MRFEIIKVLIKDVKTSGYDPYEDKVFSYNIIGQLENGRIVSIRDEKPYDLRDYIGKALDCLISVSAMGYINAVQESDEKKISSPILRG